MSRRFTLIVFSLIFATGILMVSIVRTARPQALAVEVVEEEVVDDTRDEVVEAEEMDEMEEEVDYYLAYPGILPDHPLYFLKMVRDRVRLWLTRDSVKRVELKLLYADKRVGAAKALVDGNKVDLAITTAMKAENYMFEAVDELSKLREQGEELPQVWERVEKATRKHIEILEGVVEKVPDQAKAGLERAMEVSERGYERAREVLNREVEEEGESLDESEDKQESEEEEGEVEGESVDGVEGEEGYEEEGEVMSEEIEVEEE